MPARSRTADDPRKRTPSFVCEVPLRVRPHEEHTLLARLEAARQVYNACLGEARKRVQLVRESKAFRAAWTLSKDDPERTPLFRAARTQHAFSDYAPRGVCSAARALLAGGASGQPRPPKARDARLWGRQPATPGPRQTGA